MISGPRGSLRPVYGARRDTRRSRPERIIRMQRGHVFHGINERTATAIVRVVGPNERSSSSFLSSCLRGGGAVGYRFRISARRRRAREFLVNSLRRRTRRRRSTSEQCTFFYAFARGRRPSRSRLLRRARKRWSAAFYALLIVR